MIKVIYRWTVAAEHSADFEAAWRDMTVSIRDQMAGARGSMLLRDAANPTLYTTVATWESHQARALAATKEAANPEAGARMQAAAQFVSAEVCEGPAMVVTRVTVGLATGRMARHTRLVPAKGPSVRR